MSAAADPALVRLAELLPPPASPPAPIDWDVVEARRGTRLPADYKAYLDRWGPGDVVEGVTVHADAELARWVEGALRDSEGDGDLERGAFAIWGTTESGMYLLWRTEGEPDAWTVSALASIDVAHTGLRFAEWLVAGLEGRLVADETGPVEFEPLEEGDEPRYPD